MNDYIKVADNNDLVRDASTGAIINNNSIARTNAINKRKQQQNQQLKSQQLENRLKYVESSIDHISNQINDTNQALTKIALTLQNNQQKPSLWNKIKALFN